MNDQATKDKVEALTQLMATEAEALIEKHPKVESEQVIRAVVERYGLSFNAWFCVACEIGERKQRRRSEPLQTPAKQAPPDGHRPPLLAETPAEAERLAYAGRSWPALKESKSFDSQRLNESPLFKEIGRLF